MTRIVSWFSCGAASAVATKIELENYRAGMYPDCNEFVIANCEVREEHSDNKRFLKDCERWFNHPIEILGNDKYDRSIYKVFEKTGYLVGPHGARCTAELKKKVRFDFQRPDDVLVFGYTADEADRMSRLQVAELKRNNPDIRFLDPLGDAGLFKQDCLAMIDRAGIDLPVMYLLGYRNNNCIGCVKGAAGYWNKIRVDFPDVFERMAQTEERMGIKICKIEWTENGIRKMKRISLRELEPGQGDYPSEPEIQCGILCGIAESKIRRASNG